MIVAVVALLRSTPAPSPSSRSGPAAVVSPASTVGVIVLPGSPVVFADGSPLGHVAAADADTVLVDAGARGRLSLPRSLFSSVRGAAQLSLDAHGLDAAIVDRDRRIAESRAALLKPGVDVFGPDGHPIGVVSSVGQGYVVVEVLTAGPVRLPEHSFLGVDGVLVMSTTRAQLIALMPPKASLAQ